MEVREGYKLTEIGVRPENWEVVTIDDVADVIGGGTPSTTVPNYWNGSINWFTPTEVGSSKYVYTSKRKITDDGLKSSSAKILPVGTILLTSRAGIGDLAILRDEACTNQGFQSLITNDSMDNEYLYYLMATLKNVLLKNASGSTFLEITPAKVKSIKFTLPPKPEQQAIAQTLSDTDALIDSLEKLIEKKRHIKQGAMQELLTGKRRLPGFEVKQGYKQTEIGEIPEDWEVVTIDDVADVIGGGTPSTTVPNYWNGSINWFTPTEVGSSKYVYTSKRKITDDGLKSSSAKILPVGTILLTSRAGIGDLAILRDEACTNQGFQSLITNDSMDNEYLYYLMATLKNVLLKNASGSTFLEITPTKVRNIEIAIPTLLEQQAIATVLSDMDTEIEALENKLQKTREIKDGMMHELLTGRIRLI